MKQVCVLGNGQLGRMLRQAGEPLGITVWPVGLDAEPEAVPFHQSVLLYEAMREKGKDATFYRVEGADHGGPAFWAPKTLDVVCGFLARCLK